MYNKEEVDDKYPDDHIAIYNDHDKSDRERGHIVILD